MLNETESEELKRKLLAWWFFASEAQKRGAVEMVNRELSKKQTKGNREAMSVARV